MTERPAADRRYESYSHEQMYTEVGHGNDPAEAGEISREWTELARGLREAGDTLAELSGRSENAWQGGAAEALRAVVRDAAEWSQRAAETSETVGNAVAGQAEAAARARAEMPEPVPYDPAGMIRQVVTSGDVWQLVGLSDAMAARRDEAEQARQRAVDVMYARDTALGEAVPGTRFPGPPSLTGPARDAGGGDGPASMTGRAGPV
ncbi:PPE domain-containing protein [Saccharomonospora xinjiangensis]|uniref:PPE domain-containing protein n=1 Tax=Saccharomonospora xinjiangensis TaxID=75294 RepID=UPI00106FC7E7|nr:PPE domain-containing protein [Saccharomonospora xinjiangensis]QBQ61138.1 PPE family protein [Saccharomonospora xinjiangensis]